MNTQKHNTTNLQYTQITNKNILEEKKERKYIEKYRGGL